MTNLNERLILIRLDIKNIDSKLSKLYENESENIEKIEDLESKQNRLKDERDDLIERINN